ncbi:MAG: hypothetical protein ACXV7J_00410 [Methylomonas sp.]
MVNILQGRYRLAFLLAAALVIHPVFADKPYKGEGGKHSQKEYKEHNKEHGGHDDYDRGYDDRSSYDGQEMSFRPEPYFNDQHRAAIHQYYVDEYRSGHCPPGLAKKHNGCMPPGQAKKWQIGRPLPPDVIYYEVPAGLLGYPPPGYSFVRVASDILMIAIGSGMVMDAITDLGGR